MAKYLGEGAICSASSRLRKVSYRSKLIATYVSTFAAMDTCEIACTHGHMKSPNGHST